jgi:hypothetical protein
MNAAKLLKIAITGAQETCEACGRGFTCGPLVTGCWCSRVKLSEATRAGLRRQYRACLCPGCLQQAESSQAQSRNSS